MSGRHREPIPLACPLAGVWPSTQPRTPIHRRKVGRFSQDGRAITLARARRRVEEAVYAFSGVRATTWTITPGLARLVTDIPLRADGQMRSQTQWPRDLDVAAALTFEWKGSAQVLPIDTYTRLEQNVAAIAESLENLRALERHGASVLESAMRGFAALPPPLTRRHWRAVFGGTNTDDLDVVKRVYRSMSTRVHPDKTGNVGDDRQSELNAAWADAKAELAGGS